MPMIELIPLPGPLKGTFGVEVRGVDVAAGVDSQTFQTLVRAYVEHRVLLLRDQHPSPEAYARYARLWGNPRITDGFTELNIPGCPGMNKVGNVGDLLSRADYRNGASFWHTDCAAESDANAATMLYCIQAPDTGGETVIADMQAAYQGLDVTTRDEIATLVAHHCYSGTQTIIGGAEDWELPVHTVTEETAAKLPPPAIRPLVRLHSMSGRPGLYSPAGSIVAIEGMDNSVAHRLLQRLKLHAIDRAYCYSHQYREGDILMWDNTATMHYAKPVGAATGESDSRLLYRMVLQGLPPIA